MTTAVVILNWNRPIDTLKCIDSVCHADAAANVIVVDNGSSDDSAAQIRAAYPQVTLIETGCNLGYAEGNNTGIRHALARGAEYIFVINNDAFAAPDTLDCLSAAAEAHPDGAFFGPVIYDDEAPQRVQSAGVELDILWRSHPRTGNLPAQPQPVSCLSGAALLLRASALAKIGLLDPKFFLYREDIDWCLRARRSGFRLYLVPAAHAWHRAHAVRAQDLPRITYYMTRNSLLLVQKHQGGLLRFLLLAIRFALTALSWTVRPRWRHKRAERDALLRGVFDFFRGRFGHGFFG